MVLSANDLATWPLDIHRVSYREIILAGVTVIALSMLMKYRRGVQSFGGQLPGFRVPFIPLGLPGALLPTRWWNPGLYCTYQWRQTFYKRFGSDTISIVPFIFGSPMIYTSNREVAKQTVWPGTKGRDYYKPPVAASGLVEWGMNVLGAEGAEWRRHRRVLGPAFNNELFDNVWSESIKTYHEMLDSDPFLDKNEIKTMEVQSIMTKFALTIIGRCGFGLPFDWNDDMRTPDGKLTIREAFRMVAGTFFLTSVIPRWIRILIPTKSMRESVEAQDHAFAFMTAQVAERRRILQANHDKSNSVLGKDIFTMLVEANEKENAKFKLADDELISNVYVMLLAGHETTATTLSATLGFLSVNQHIQQELYDQIVKVVGLDRDPVIDDQKSLEKVRNAFLEAMRMFPPVYILMREAFEDTVLQLAPPFGSNEEPTIIPVTKGTMVVIDIVGIQNNPRYFDKPEEYNPSRWEGVSLESESVSAFSSGPRVCIGRKFAMTEVMCFLILLLRDFKIEPILQAAETDKEWTKRVMDGHIFIGLGVKSIPLSLRNLDAAKEGYKITLRYFDKPKEYDPSRWEGVSLESESISAFSSGPRVCIGRKFAMTEAICFLTQLLRDSKVEPLLKIGETENEWTDRVMDGHIFITLGLKNIPIKFVRRKMV